MQPIGLITANVITECASLARSRPEAWKDENTVASTADAAARKILCNVAHESPMATVRKALAALDVPSTQDEIIRSINAAADTMAREEGAAP